MTDYSTKDMIGPSKSDIQKIRKAIANASTLEEVERLNKMLQSGQFSLKEMENIEKKVSKTNAPPEEEEEEEDEEEEQTNGEQEEEEIPMDTN